MLTLGVIFGGSWLLVILGLCTPRGYYTNAWDRLTKARGRSDRVNLQIMLDHLRSFPEQWSIRRDAVSFPLEGSKQIYLNRGRDGKWSYTLSAFDDGARPLDGYFGPQFTQEIDKLNSRKEATSLLRNLHPNLDSGVLLLK